MIPQKSSAAEDVYPKDPGPKALFRVRKDRVFRINERKTVLGGTEVLVPVVFGKKITHILESVDRPAEVRTEEATAVLGAKTRAIAAPPARAAAGVPERAMQPPTKIPARRKIPG